MKAIFYLLLCAGLEAATDFPSVKIMAGQVGNASAMQSQITFVIQSYEESMRAIRDELRNADVGNDPGLQAVSNPALKALDNLIDQNDVSKVQDILPLVDWLNANQSHPITTILGDTAAQGTLNYLIDCIYTARMVGAADTVGDYEVEAMLRFYAGNPAQTSEGSWQTNNTMLFVFGDRVLNTLAKKFPERINAFYKAVQDARKSAQSGPGPDEEAIPETERPTAEQLQKYEASFNRLEALVVKGVLPKGELPEKANLPQASVIRDVGPSLPSPLGKDPAATAGKEPASSTRWILLAVLAAMVVNLYWWIKKRRS